MLVGMSQSVQARLAGGLSAAESDPSIATQPGSSIATQPDPSAATELTDTTDAADLAPASARHFLDYELIAHAGGAQTVNGEPVSYANSREAVLESYAKGHRVLEVDVDLTSDGRLVLVHFWHDLHKLAGLDVDAPITHAEFKNLKFFGQYTPLDIDDFVALVQELPDIFVIIDTKSTGQTGFRRVYTEILHAVNAADPQLIGRITPQIYNPDHLAALDQLHHFPEIIYTLWRSPQGSRDVVRFVASEPRIIAVSMWGHRALAEPGFVRQLVELDRTVLAHTIDSRTTFTRLQAIGVSSIMTNTLHPDSLH